MGPLDKFILDDDALSATTEGCALQIRSHWYRSLPLSSIGILTVNIDGANIPAENITFEINGQRHALNRLPALHDEWWFILDAATLHLPTPMTANTSHEITLELGLLLPYILVGPNAEPLLSSSRVQKLLLCLEALPSQRDTRKLNEKK
jgi:Domain of unknown function (DUF6379)